MERSRHQAGDLESHGLVDVTDMSRFDEERLYQLIEHHLHYTGSARREAILDDWSAYLPKFVKVMPVEYRRALEEMATPQVLDTGRPRRDRDRSARRRQRQISLQAEAICPPRHDEARTALLALRAA